MSRTYSDGAINPGVGDVIQVTTPRSIAQLYPQLAGVRMFKLLLFYPCLEQFTAETVLSDSESIATFVIGRADLLSGPFKILTHEKVG